MAWNDEVHVLERCRRTDAAIARATASHMSDTKWRKLFTVLRELNLGDLHWKFVGDDRVFVQGVPLEWGILAHSLGDVLPAPYDPYRYIDWIEIRGSRATETREALQAIGSFPLAHTDSGLRVVAYTWSIASEFVPRA